MQPSSQGFKYILSIMDIFSRFSRFYPLRDMFANKIAEKISYHCCTFGFPRLILTDAASNFTAALSHDIFSALTINHTLTIPYRHNPAMVERVHYPLKKGLSILCHGAPASWPKYLDKVSYALNTAHNGTLGCSPMEAFFLRQNNPQPSLGDLNLNETCDLEMIQELTQRRAHLKEVSTQKKAEYIEHRNKYIKQSILCLVRLSMLV